MNVSDLSTELGLLSDQVRMSLRVIPTDVAFALTPEQVKVLVKAITKHSEAVYDEAYREGKKARDRH